MRVASLGMYDFPWLREATDAFWATLRDVLRDAGIADVPEALDRSRPLDEIWRDPSLLLAQTCGYPLMTTLAGRVQVVATPVYDFPGCEGAWHRSLVVVRADDPAESLAAMRGRRCAINGWDSNTGMNLLRAAIAPLAGGRPFFASVTVTGAHLESLRAVREGRADLAAIDCVTHGLAGRRQPELLEGTRVLCATEATPGLPFVTAVETPEAALRTLREAVQDAAEAGTAAILGLLGSSRLGGEVYRRVMDLEKQAAAMRCPVLA